MITSPISSNCGVLLIDKRSGWTSLDAVRRVRRILGVRKVGHAGTLDPFATGLLPVCVGESTKVVSYLVEGTKTYVASLRLGQETDTLDRDGELVREAAWDHVSLEEVKEAAREFEGRIEQVPPRYSALKIKGRRLYEYARAGEEISIPSRFVDVHELRVLDKEGPVIRMAVTCGKGTYIRAIARDLGRKIGCGAHLAELRRTRMGDLRAEDGLAPEQLEAADKRTLVERLLRSDQALAHLPSLRLTEELTQRVEYGQRIPVDQLPEPIPEDAFRVLDSQKGLVALARVEEGCLRVERGFVTRW